MEIIENVIEIMTQVFQFILILFLSIVGASIAWWITMEPSHKKILGGTQLKATKAIFKYGLFGRLPEQKDKTSGEK